MDTKTYTMLKTAKGSRDGLTVETFQKGESYDLSPDLAEQFYHQGAVEEAGGTAEGETREEGEPPAGSNGKKNPADARQKKVTGPAETKVVAPAETKGGEAGVDADTQRVEELVAVARDTYGLDVDSTMDEDDLRSLIEDAEAASQETDGKTRKTRKK